ncbi:polyprenyl synthetase family protein [Halothiobacillus neapolitanus]|uniref:Polyprenyl synthetase n=1 Tax=Halothiobacillus neapolitanus (strain ATCC 23641 / DSM 15147 / CIP 104769 / NCIMB 8539 / c2) TaxID=555778 RepID=D0L1D0_HALNC|nr:farnesyl diphosphate synthase [Halothiobacillus neapolitanus]ACX96503.1 Polyprenyl synthetase [Halothiobacillus neapolitanus c2]TDN65389.1 farnesyl-diphosphate synthase [Halothiobacillus neapolitanus]
MFDHLTIDTVTFQSWQSDFQTAFDIRLKQRLGNMLGESPQRLKDAIGHAVIDGGKRLRPILVVLGASLDSTPGSLPDPNDPRLEQLWNAAVAIELIHGYSLIHDDLPSMDNDDLRRGKPTVHRVFDEATAILAGDALQSLAFSLLADAPQTDVKTRLNWVSLLSTGANRMVFGQQLDLNPPAQIPALAELTRMHELKTGALLYAALMMGANQSSAEDRAALEAFIRPLGLAFQIQDDILDATGTAEQLGKTPGKDAADHKYSYVTVLGLDAARIHLNATMSEALNALEPMGTRACGLRACARFVLMRDH